MKRVLTWFAGLAGIAALGRHLSRRPHHAETAPEPHETAADDPAEELRRRLAGARQSGSGAETEPTADAAPADETLEARRARVHAKAREAIDAMGDDGSAA